MTVNENDNQERLQVPVDETDNDLCRVVWLSVIMQGLSDALSSSDNYPFKQRREEALEWFAAKEGSGSDFAMICELAGVDFKMAQKRIQMFIDGNLPAIDFRCFRKGKFDAPATESRKHFFTRVKAKEIRNSSKMQPRFVSRGSFRNLPLRFRADNDTSFSRRRTQPLGELLTAAGAS